MVGVVAPKRAAPVRDAAADAVHHAAERVGGRAGRGALVRPPARALRLELRPHVAAAVVGGVELVRHEVLRRPVRPGLQPDHLQAGPREQRRHEAADRSHPDHDDVGVDRGRRHRALRGVPGNPDRLPRQRPVGRPAGARQVADLAALRDRLRGEVLLRGVLDPQARVPEEPPALQIAVTAVRRVREDALLHVREQQVGEDLLVGNLEAGQRARPHRGDEVVLLVRLQVGEPGAVQRPRGVVQGSQPDPVRLVVVPVEPRQGPVHVCHSTDLAGGGAVLVGREEPVEHGRQRPALVRAEADQGVRGNGHVSSSDLRVGDAGHVGGPAGVERVSGPRSPREC